MISFRAVMYCNNLYKANRMIYRGILSASSLLVAWIVHFLYIVRPVFKAPYNLYDISENQVPSPVKPSQFPRILKNSNSNSQIRIFLVFQLFVP